jgi:hypothetical protein
MRQPIKHVSRNRRGEVDTHAHRCSDVYCDAAVSVSTPLGLHSCDGKDKFEGDGADHVYDCGSVTVYYVTAEDVVCTPICQVVTLLWLLSRYKGRGCSGDVTAATDGGTSHRHQLAC